MSKRLPVIWSPEAGERYADILPHIILEWSLISAKKFNDKTEKLIEILQTHHHLCPESKVKKLRKCIITVQTSLIYRINADFLEIVTFIDNRSRHPY